MITTRDLNVPLDYNSLSKKEKQEICRTVIELAFSKMSVQATEEQRVAGMRLVLGRSLQENEALEAYEDCAILRDLLQELQKYANNKPRKTKTNPQDSK